MGKENTKQPPAQVFEPSQLDATSENAAAVLQQTGDRAVNLVQAWIDKPNVEALSAAAWDDNVKGPVRKAARRGLNVLKSRGIAIPERKKNEPPKPNAPHFEAWYMPSSGAGFGFYTIGTRPVAGQNLQIVEVHVHEGAGVVDVTTGFVAAGAMRDYFKRVAAERGFQPVSVPVSWARWRVNQAKKRNEASGMVLPMAFSSSSELLEPVPAEPPPHPIDEIGIAVGDEHTQAVSKETNQLHNYPEFNDWLPDKTAVDEMLRRVGERIGPQHKQEQPVKVDPGLMEEEILAATDRFFTPEIRQGMADRMKDLALSVYARKGEQTAAYVLATANAVKSAGLITSPPRDVPFLTSFFRKTLAWLASQNKGQLQIPIPTSNSDTGPVVAPPEALEAAARTRAGIDTQQNDDATAQQQEPSADAEQASDTTNSP